MKKFAIWILALLLGTGLARGAAASGTDNESGSLYAADISGFFKWPVPASKYITSLDYHRDKDDMTGKSDRLHGGMDISGETGMRINAAAAGTVVRTANGCRHTDAGSDHNCYGKDADPWGDYGNYVVLEHVINGRKFTSVYGHLRRNSFSLKVGDRVSAGAKVGEMGSSGGSISPHLHLEIYTGVLRGSQKDANIKRERALTFQYYQNNVSILRGMTFAFRCQDSSRAFGNWITDHCAREDDIFSYTGGNQAAAPSAAKITFNVNGGTFRDGEADHKTLLTGSVYGVFPAPVRKAHDLAGWYTAAAGGKRVTETDIFTGPDGQTLYAHWKDHDGWVTKDGKTKYYDEYGEMATGLKKIKGEKYYFNENGNMQTDRKIMIGKHVCYFGSDGRMAKDLWITINGDVYYFGDDGKMYTGFRKVGSYKYFFSDYGHMKPKVIVTIDGSSYYFNGKGRMVKSKWVTYNGNRYYAGPKGKLVKDRKKKIGRKTYYFDSYCRMVRSRFIKIGPYYYYFTEDGTMATKWKTISGSRFYFGKDGKAYTGTHTIGGKRFVFSTYGRLIG